MVDFEDFTSNIHLNRRLRAFAASGELSLSHAHEQARLSHAAVAEQDRLKVLRRAGDLPHDNIHGRRRNRVRIRHVLFHDVSYCGARPP